MNSRTKAITAVIALLPVAIAGLYLSGFLVLTLLGEHAQVQLLTYWRYWQVVDQPAWHPYAMKIKLSGICGFGLPVMLYLIMVYAMLRTKARELYGNARWARSGDLSRHDVLKDDPRGLIACRFGRRFIRIQSKHLLLAASTRGGKGVSVVIPNLLAWLESAVILDVKREAWEKTAGQRAKYGQVYLFDPFSDDGSTHRWKIKLSGICGFGLPVMLYLIMVYAMLRTKARELYGNARWARSGDLSRHDVLKDDPRGLIACRFGRRFIRIQSKHLLLAASTRGGKGVSVVIPNLLAWLESAVILDVKREAWEKTAGQRAKYGQVYLFDPFSDDGSTHRWNPLGYVRLDPNHRNGDIVACHRRHAVQGDERRESVLAGNGPQDLCGCLRMPV
ncbi:type IV secretory system conjugative DNA transfer family protein [Xanthomonas sp. MUS 060]|uniref:type IV secretory system conjugative DNA transfer family protein n=1 Tax=Xanthomonas sp. MUS 060 TaxID=1588031 RepID=UPI0006978A3D|nr:type IV secretory system conjugative DNA transfer family protein [Xanthomonas sp. MUS 060]